MGSGTKKPRQQAQCKRPNKHTGGLWGTIKPKLLYDPRTTMCVAVFLFFFGGSSKMVLLSSRFRKTSHPCVATHPPVHTLYRKMVQTRTRVAGKPTLPSTKGANPNHWKLTLKPPGQTLTLRPSNLAQDIIAMVEQTDAAGASEGP